MTSPTLLWGRGNDPHLEVVANELARRSAPVVRLESDRGGVWPPGEFSGYRAFARRETWGDTCARPISRPEALWFAHPARMYAAEDVLAQTNRAREFGFRTARISSSADDGPKIGWLSKYRFRTDRPGIGARTAWAPEVRCRQPGIVYQEFIDKSWEIRASVVDDVVVAVLYRPASNREILDWSFLEPASLELMSVCLPREMQRRVCALVRSYGLRFAAIDFLLPKGESSLEESVFLELNPFAAWRWLDDLHAPTVTELIVDAFLRGDGGCLGARGISPAHQDCC